MTFSTKLPLLLCITFSMFVYILLSNYISQIAERMNQPTVHDYSSHISVTHHTTEVHANGQLDNNYMSQSAESINQPAVRACSSHRLKKKHVTEVHVDGQLDCLLSVYNNEINQYRSVITHANNNSNLEHYSNTKYYNNQTYRVAIGNFRCPETNCDYFGIIELYNQVKTIKVSWKELWESNGTSARYPYQYHYMTKFPPKAACSASKQSDECTYHITSQYNLTKVYTVLHPHETPADQGFPKFIFFLHIIRGGQIDNNGNVRTGQLDIIPFQCQERHVSMKENVKTFVEEIFVIKQFWGNGYFHSNVEDMIRVTPYLEFLRGNPSIYIHGPRILKNTLPMLGLDSDRLIEGNIRANIIYLPQGSGCGASQPLQIQLLHKKYQQSIHQNKNTYFRAGPWNSVVQIVRSHKRFLLEKKEVSALLKKYAAIYNFTYEQFIDKPLPSFNETVSMFARARIVVAPHGAGLSNLLFSRVGTRVIEILKSRHLVPCYYELHTCIAQPYVGLLNRKDKNDVTLSVDVAYLEKLVENMMKAVRQSR